MPGPSIRVAGLMTLALFASLAFGAPPGEIGGVGFDDPGVVHWSPDGAADSYNVYRSEIAGLALGLPGRCHGFELPGTTFVADDDPAPGTGWFYLVTGESTGDGEGAAGADSDGTPRPLLGRCRAVMRGHVQDRLGFGSDEWSQARIDALGFDGYIEEQLDPDSIDDASNTALNNALAGMSPPVDIFELIGNQTVRSVYSRRQLEEQATVFWTNHFNTYWAKVAQIMQSVRPPCLVPPRPQCDPNFPAIAWEVASGFQYDESQTFRDLAFHGTFREMLGASALSPAMILYLDTYVNLAGVPNENYPRELLELYSQGVNNGYTQQDIEELSKVFSGWSICKRTPANAGNPIAPCIPNYWEVDGVWDAAFFDFRHDCTQKTLYPGTAQQVVIPDTCVNKIDGVNDVQAALDAIAAHPATARFISTKILQRFVTETPSETQIDELVAAWNDPTNPNGIGDMREVLRAALTSEAFLDPDLRGGKVKTPFEHMVSALRALRGYTDGVDRVVNYLVQAQHLPYYNEVPTGYPELGGAWIDTANTLERQNLGIEIALTGSLVFGSDPIGLLQDQGIPAGPGNAAEIVDFFADVLFGGALTPAERQTAIDFLLTNDQGVPSFFNASRIRQTVGFLLGYPQFQEQ